MALGGPSSSSQHLWGGNQEDRGGLFAVVHGRRMRNNGDELQQGKSQLGIKKKKITVRVIKQWNKLSSELVGSLLMEFSKT